MYGYSLLPIEFTDSPRRIDWKLPIDSEHEERQRPRKNVRRVSSGEYIERDTVRGNKFASTTLMSTFVADRL